MSVSIKLSRFGAKNNCFYRIVAGTTRSKVDGKNLGIIGTYDPKKKKLELDNKKLEDWIKKGAILTEGVRKIITKKTKPKILKIKK